MNEIATIEGLIKEIYQTQREEAAWRSIDWNNPESIKRYEDIVADRKAAISETHINFGTRIVCQNTLAH